VCDVVAVSSEQIRTAPSFESKSIEANFIAGVASLPERMLVLVDILALLSASSLGIFPKDAPAAH
jgi:purine-binding chemotaxis protein CheW